MADPLHYRKSVEAVAAHSPDKSRKLIASIPEDQVQTYLNYLAATFTAFLEEYFGEEYNRDKVATLVNRLRHEYIDAEPKFNPLTAEGVIRGCSGELHLMEDIPTNEVVHYQMLVIGSLSQDGTVVRADLYKVLETADEIMAEWDSEED
ncbi:hypothetical protein [Salininema proteolyticum]|uniref:Transcriptional regulator n=1 Tax=Salininema proteolyticum TaxID=1607685 RepID=A0ABV8TWX4_9ACTN